MTRLDWHHKRLDWWAAPVRPERHGDDCTCCGQRVSTLLRRDLSRHVAVAGKGTSESGAGESR